MKNTRLILGKMEDILDVLRENMKRTIDGDYENYNQFGNLFLKCMEIKNILKNRIQAKNQKCALDKCKDTIIEIGQMLGNAW